MQQSALQLPDPTALSRGVLLGALGIALAALLLSFVITLYAIPSALQQQVDDLLASRGSGAIASRVRGRDVTLSGSLDASIDRNALVDEIRSVPGVRVVRDDMRESDPAEQSQLEALAFREAIEGLPISEVAFDAGSSNLTAASEPVLDALARLLAAYPDQRIRIAGHTDNTGRSSVNLRISRERAQRVADYLTRAGTEPGRIIAQGYGDSQPLADNGSERGRAANRRIGISFID